MWKKAFMEIVEIKIIFAVTIKYAYYFLTLQ